MTHPEKPRGLLFPCFVKPPDFSKFSSLFDLPFPSAGNPPYLHGLNLKGSAQMSTPWEAQTHPSLSSASILRSHLWGPTALGYPSEPQAGNMEIPIFCSCLPHWFMNTGSREGWGKGVGNGHIHIAVFKMDHQQGPTAQHGDLCSMICGSLDGRGVWGRMDSCTCIAESLPCSPEMITTVLIGYTSIQNKKIF